MYAVLWAARQAPWEIGASLRAEGSGLFKSTDGGSTWQALTGGLPTVAQGLGPHRHRHRAQRPAAHVRAGGRASEGGVYRSDDAGANWRRVNREERIWGRGSDFACVRVDPERQGHHLRRQHFHLPLDGRRR